MDGVKRPDDLDLLLRQTMAEEPSVEFLPRVRERIATERVRPRWSWRAVALAGAAAAAVITLAVVPRGIEDVKIPLPPTQPPAIHEPVLNAIADPTPLDAPVVVREPVRAAVRRRQPDLRPTDVGDMPPVIVDRRQQVALGRIVRLAAEGRFGDEDLAPATATSLQPVGERVGEIAVRPVEVSRIQVGGVLQAGAEPRQPPRPSDAGFSRP